MALTRDEILAAIGERKKTTTVVPVPEWGGDVHIRMLTAADLKAVGFFDGARGDAASLPTTVLQACLADADGEQLFTKKDLAELANADFATVLRVFTEAAKINGLSNDELEVATAAFTKAQSDDTSSS